jgi:hypothetical protein
VCEVKYTSKDLPITFFISLIKIFLSRRFWVPEDDEGRYPQYLTAARHGAMSALNNTETGSCEQQYRSCSVQARHIFDLDALNFWKFLTSTFNFRISE